jgi:hypothetical protein
MAVNWEGRLGSLDLRTDDGRQNKNRLGTMQGLRLVH